MGQRTARAFRVICSAVITAIVVSAGIPAATADEIGSVGAWTTSTHHAPLDVSGAASVTFNDYVYVIGGSSSSGATWLDTVNYAKVNSDGSVGSWITSSNPIPHGVYYPSAVTANGYIYVMGGYGGGMQNAVYYAKLNSDGSIGSWITSSHSLPQAAYEASAVAHDGYIYFIGGLDENSHFLDTVYYAKVNSDGSVDSWITSPNSLPEEAADTAATVVKDRVYIMGGDMGSNFKDSSYYAVLNDDGSVGSWDTDAATLPQALDAPTATSSNGYIYLAGGNTDSSTTKADVYYTRVNDDGSLAGWTTSSNSLPQPLRYAISTVHNGYWYVITGQNGGLTQDSVYYAQLHFVSAQSANTPDNQPFIIATPAGTNITSISSTPNVVADSGHSYPLGLTSFTFTTSSIENQITLTFKTGLTPDQVVARKYNSTTHIYSDIPGAVIADTTLSGEHALRLTYTIADGGPLDEDGEVNGVIIDPVGLAQVNGTAAPNTGYGKPVSNGPFIVAFLAAGVLAISIALRMCRPKVLR